MKSATLAIASALLFFLAGITGCDRGAEPVGTEPADDQAESPVAGQEPPGVTAEEYPIRGTVTAIDRDAPSVTLDHEEIEGLMGAMTMEFQVENGQALEEIEEGDQVQGRLVKRDGQYMITEVSETPE